ncbi:Hypothetical predicted protein, partial [Pelobates cultripes]
MSKVHTKLLFRTIVSACNLIAKHWKSRVAPTKTRLITQMQTNWEYEHMAAHQLEKKGATTEAGHIWDKYWNT